ncbi:M3 family metallopeptidase [Mesorhizobium sp. BR1-1-16]|uniref:M3 family metallopeptidase n=1 Tax=Mesorhizobium sp. BR1-1-16 TaxID=2876653 RepID=UPI001CC9E1EE|nr:M3 family metallopeptidase [Mesorhizobium sp. BR1-1-16]MBZ9935862.1 M3 family metallopeptidase [Mesorhizobium sp. BR1-1-16]
MTADNPLLSTWTTPFGMPPFAAIEPAHYRPAFEAAIAEHQREIAVIAGRPEAPTFANTIEAMERAGRMLDRVASVFFNLTGAHTNDALEAIEMEVAPLLSRHRSSIYLSEALFQRIDALAKAGDAGLDAEQARVLERYHTGFRRSGAGLPAETKARLAAISERLATLGTTFGQNVLADEKGWTLVLEAGDDLAGLPDFLIASASQAARDRGLEGKYLITLSRSSIEPFLQFSARRDLREKAFEAWTARGEAGKTDNRAIIAETVALRAEQAELLGFESFAHFRLDDSMAKTPEAAMNLLTSVWAPARARAIEERAALQALVHAEGGNFELAAWDWRYYSERRRKAEFDLDEAGLKPYLQLDKVIEAAFDTATRLFGVSFQERKDVPAYHPDVRVFEVTNASGELVGIFLGDYFARPSKRSGAWMSDYRGQERLIGDVRPIIVNVMNFARGADGAPTLLSYDDARTLFHEFGHGLHGLLSDVTYPSIAGTSVARDFVEFPSQLYEHWFERPEILERFAVHYRTGEPMPAALIERLKASRSFNQGFATVEYVSSALVDLRLHLLKDGAGLDSTAFEKGILAEIGMPQAMVMRHRTPHFQHVFAGDGYSSAYYSYLWSETLDADGFDAFEEAGNIFAPDVAARLKEFVYSAGNRRKPDEAYRAFRGRDPDPSALLRKRGLMDTAV